MHTVGENYKALTLIDADEYTSTETGTGVDVTDYGDDAMAILDFGTCGGTAATCDVTIQTSDASGGTYTTVATFTQVDENDDDTIAAAVINLAGKNSNGEEQKFVRAVATLGGGSPDFNLAVILLVRAEKGSSSLNSVTPA